VRYEEARFRPRDPNLPGAISTTPNPESLDPYFSKKKSEELTPDSPDSELARFGRYRPWVNDKVMQEEEIGN
jgi:hypothetical protein